MNLHDEIILASDLQRLYQIEADLAELSLSLIPEQREVLAKVISKLETFSDIHKVRTQDMLTFRDKIKIARDEYGSLQRKYTATTELLNTKQEVINKLLNEKI